MSVNLDVRRKILDFPKFSVQPDEILKPQLEEVIVDGSLVLVDPLERMSPYSYGDFNLRTLIEAGVDLKELPTISLSRLDAARFAANLYVNLESFDVKSES